MTIEEALKCGISNVEIEFFNIICDAVAAVKQVIFCECSINKMNKRPVYEDNVLTQIESFIILD